MLLSERKPGKWRQQLNVNRWMQDWQVKFGSFGVQVIVADVAQSFLVVDVAERTVILAPSLKLSAAERMLEKVYMWWKRQNEMPEERLCSLVSC